DLRLQRARLFENPGANVIRVTHIDKMIFVTVPDAVGEPAMYPLSGRDRPGITAFIRAFDAEENFHPNNRRPSERLFPLRHSQRDFIFRRSLEREFVLASRTFLATGIECVTGAANTDRIDFLSVDRRPVLQPTAGLLLQRLQSLLRNAAIARLEIEPGKKFARVCDPPRLGVGIKIRARANATSDRFDQIQKLSTSNLAALVCAEQQRFPFAHTPVPFALT